MRFFWLVLLVLPMCQQRVEIIDIRLPQGYSGWVFVIENNSKASEESEYHGINEKGVAYIATHGSKEMIQLKLYSSNNEDISDNVKLFKTSVYGQYQKKKARNVYLFYYPTDEELALDDDVWLDFDFYEKYNTQAIMTQAKLESEGFFE